MSENNKQLFSPPARSTDEIELVITRQGWIISWGVNDLLKKIQSDLGEEAFPEASPYCG
jgi:hypothetical protein